MHHDQIVFNVKKQINERQLPEARGREKLGMMKKF